MCSEKMGIVFGKKRYSLFFYLLFIYLFFWIGKVKHICTYFTKHTYFTKYKSHNSTGGILITNAINRHLKLFRTTFQWKFYGIETSQIIYFASGWLFDNTLRIYAESYFQTDSSFSAKFFKWNVNCFEIVEKIKAEKLKQFDIFSSLHIYKLNISYYIP